ncbi:uncharacterized protein LOC136753654 [Amia ocellicauda]|uniref:uncharacterized protein LOC136753654 n=1 Tax=Amia ocellicauda TaxID=2972642 RepID=UPI0034645FBE
MLLFQCSINHNNRSQSHFPVYQKDHLFSSNPGWDFGAFRQLEHLIKESHFNLSRFAHVFSEPGKYVFLDNTVPEWSLIVVVTELGTDCDPRAAVFQPSSPVQLVRHGILKQHRLNLLPDWGAIAGVLGFLLLVITVLTTSALILKPVHSGLSPLSRLKPKWRSLGEPRVPASYIYTGGGWEGTEGPGCRGEGEGAEAEEPAISKGGTRTGTVELEEFNVRTLYDKLEDQTLHLASQLSKHRSDTQEFYRNICRQIDTLKDVVEHLDSTKLKQLGKMLQMDPAVTEDAWFGDCAKLANQINTEPKRQLLRDSSLQLLEAVLRALEGMAFRLDNENMVLHQMIAEQGEAMMNESGPDYRYEQGFHGSSKHWSPGLADLKGASDTQPLHSDSVGLQSTAPCLSEKDLCDLIALTPLSRTLRQIQESLQSLPTAETGGLANDVPVEETVGDLLPVDLWDLSPQHFAIFLFGCHTLRLLRNTGSFPHVTLLIAHTVPVRAQGCSGVREYCFRDFYYDRSNQILYLHKTKLGNVGEFISTILHSMACIASGTIPHDFIKAFHQAVSTVGAALFIAHCSSRTEDAHKPNKAIENRRRAMPTFVEDFLAMKVPPDPCFTEDCLAERLKSFKGFLLHQHLQEIKLNTKETRVNGKNKSSHRAPFLIYRTTDSNSTVQM